MTKPTDEEIAGSFSMRECEHYPKLYIENLCAACIARVVRDAEAAAKEHGFAAGLAAGNVIRRELELEVDRLTLVIESSQRDVAAAREPLGQQIEKLAGFIIAEVEGEPSQSEGAVDTAIRVIRELEREVERLRDWRDASLKVDAVVLSAKQLEAVKAAARAEGRREERERCARRAEDFSTSDGYEIAAAIRALEDE